MSTASSGWVSPEYTSNFLVVVNSCCTGYSPVESAPSPGSGAV